MMTGKILPKCENTISDFCRFLRLIDVIVTLVFKRQIFYVNNSNNTRIL